MNPWNPLLAVLILTLPGLVRAEAHPSAPPAVQADSSAARRPALVDTLPFVPFPAESSAVPLEGISSELPGPTPLDGEEWLRMPFGDHLLTDPDEWRARHNEVERGDVTFDYNRVDRLRLGVAGQIQSPETMYPRLGGRLEYSTSRKRTLYGAQIEQPLLPPGRLSFGVSMVRCTDHSDLQQVDDLENSLALLLGRQDYRDYFEREGIGAYLSWRVPDFSTVSLHYRDDRYRSLGLDGGTRSWFELDRRLRRNPPVDEGQVHAAVLRLERLAHQTRRTRAGFYHWIEVERAGRGLGGDFEYGRALADLRNVLRLSPATTLALRLVGGSGFQGALPVQKQFTVGGVDGLRGHSFAQFRGDQMLLGQAEYSVGLWRLHTHDFAAGLSVLAFVDGGRAWSNPDHVWDIGRQHFGVDGGFGFATAEDNLRIYFAKDLQQPDSDFVISLRLQRPF